MIRKSILRMAAVALPFVAIAPAAGAQAAAAKAPALPAAQGILAKYAAAVGGPAYLAAKSVVTKGTMSMPAAGLSAPFELVQLAPNRMQMVTTIPGMGEVRVGYDGAIGWAMDPMQGPRLLTGGELDQIKDESDRRGNLRSSEMFSAVETVSDTTMNSERCYLVKLTWKTGRQSQDCYSPTTGLLVASRSMQKTPMGEILVVTSFSDYKQFGGITVATKTVQDVMGQQQILTVSSVELGNGAGLEVVPPPAIQALAKPAK
jgi:hypothetical protein